MNTVATIQVPGLSKKANTAIGNIISTPGFHITGFVFDPSKITPRIMNRTIKFLELGYTVGNGQSVRLALTLSDIADLHVDRQYGLNISIPYELPLEDREKLKQIITADHAAFLLTQEKSVRSRIYMYNSKDWKQQVEDVYSNNLYHVDHVKTRTVNPKTNMYVGTMSFWTEENQMLAMSVIAAHAPADIKERRRIVVGALRKGEPWQVSLS